MGVKPTSRTVRSLNFFETTSAYKTALIITLMISAGVYLNSLQNDFVYDDVGHILENRWITDVRYIPEIFMSSAWSFQSKSMGSNTYRPMLHLIYMLNYHIFGLKPWGFHLINIALHISVSVLVFVVARKLLMQFKTLESSYILPAFVASVLFAAHPIHTEVVAWIAGILELLYTCLLLLSFYFYVRSGEGMRRGYILSVVFFFIALLSKEQALVLPFILASYDIISRKEAGVHFGYLRRYAPYLIVSGIYLALRFNAIGGFSPQEPNIKLSTYGYIINVFPLFMKYLEKLILPVNLNAFHVLHPISSIFEPRGIISLAVTASFIVIEIISFKKNRLVFFSLLLIALPLLPVLYIPALGENVFAERYLYLPSFGFVMLIGLAFSRVLERKPRMAGLPGIFLVMLAVGYAIGTVNRNVIWKNNLTLFADSVRKSPGAALLHNNLGYAYLSLGRFDEAINEYIIALKINPDYVNAHNNLGYAYFSLGRFDEAINEYKIASKIGTDHFNAHNNLGYAYFSLGRFDEAISEYIIALKIDPNRVDVHNNLGYAYSKLGRFDDAAYEFKKALSLNPEDAAALKNLEILDERIELMKGENKRQ